MAFGRRVDADFGGRSSTHTTKVAGHLNFEPQQGGHDAFHRAGLRFFSGWRVWSY
jgi:hypothetical protein